MDDLDFRAYLNEKLFSWGKKIYLIVYQFVECMIALNIRYDR